MRVVTIFLSSLDEQVGSYGRAKALGGTLPLYNNQVFDNQDELLEWIIKNQKKFEDKLMIYIRTHPRSGRDVRNDAVSQHLSKIRNIAKLVNTECIKFIWPEDSISSYILAMQSDLCIVPWSSMVHELGRLGIPVINTFKDYKSACQFPEDISIGFETKEDIKSLMLDGKIRFSVERLIKNHRFYIWRTLSGCLDIEMLRKNQDRKKSSRDVFNNMISPNLNTEYYSSLLSCKNEFDLEEALKKEKGNVINAERELIISRLNSYLNGLEKKLGYEILAKQRIDY